MAEENLYRDIKVALADMREAHEDMDIQLPDITIICGYRVDGVETHEAIEVYRKGEKTPFKTVYVVTDRFNPYDEVLEKSVRIVSSAIENARQVKCL